MERRSPRTAKKSPRTSRSPRASKTPDRRQSVTSDVLRRMVLTSSAHKLERDQTKSGITPRSMITEYLSSQQTAEPVVRQKRRAASTEPESTRKKSKIAVADEETPRTVMDRFLSQLQTQTPVVRQARRRRSEEEATNIDDVIGSSYQKRRSESFMADDEDDDNLVPSSQPVQQATRAAKGKPIKSSFVAEQLGQLDWLRQSAIKDTSVSSQRGHLDLRGLSKFGSQLGQIIHDSSASLSAESTPSSSQTYPEERTDPNASRGVTSSKKKKKVSTGKKRKSEESHNEQDSDAEIDTNEDAGDGENASESSSIRDQAVSVSGIELIPSSDVDENTSLQAEFIKPQDGISPIIPDQTPGRLVERRRSSGLMAPKPRAPVMTTLSDRKIRMTNAFEPTDVVRRVSSRSTSVRESHSTNVTTSRSTNAKTLELNASIEKRQRSFSVTPKARLSTSVRQATPLSTTLVRRESTARASLETERRRASRLSTPQSSTTASPAARAETPRSASSAPYLLNDKENRPHTSNAASPRPPARPRAVERRPRSQAGNANPNLYEFFNSMEKRDVTRVRTTPKKKTPVKRVAKVTAKPKKTPVKKQAKPRKKEIGMNSATMREMFKHYCRFPVASTAFEEIESLCEEFWENAASDLSAYAAHSGRQAVTSDDLVLLMRRQRFITEKESLYSLVEKNLPLEYREKIIPMAISGNKLTKTGMKAGRRGGKGRRRKQSSDDNEGEED